MEQVTYDEKLPMLDLGDDPMVGPKQEDIQADAIWHGIPIEGFSGPGEEMIRATISRIPPELLKNVHRVKAAPELQPKHGRYDPETHTVNINPLIFNLRQRFGEGQGWIYHTELCLVHEVGHSIYYFLPEKTKDQWRDLSGWMVGTQEGQAPPYKETRPGWPKDTSKWTHQKGIKFTRKYAQKNDDEDFADSFAFFLLNKPHQMEPSKRDFVHKMIDERVKKYPQTLVEGPTKPYGERDLQAGGPGSGCNPEVANPRCGRPSTGLITVGEMNRIGNSSYRPRYRQLVERLADGKWHQLTAPEFTKPSPRTGFYTGMRSVLRPLGFNVETRAGKIRLVRIKQEQPTTMDVLERGQRGELTQDQVREQLQQLRHDEAVRAHPGYFTEEDRQQASQRLREESNRLLQQLGPQTSGLQPGRATTGTIREADQARQTPAPKPPIQNTNPDFRKPKGFLAKDDKPTPEEISKDNIVLLGENGDTKKVAENFEEFFGMSPKDYKDAILKGVDRSIADGARLRISQQPYGDAEGNHYWQVAFSKPEVFQMERTFFPKDKTVSHGYFVIQPQYEGKDFAKQLFANSVDMYDHLGVEKIDVHANLSVGGYAWARYGFVPSQSSWDNVRDEIKESLYNNSNYSADVKAQIRLIANIEDPKAIWLMAALKDKDNKSVGWSLLSDTDWDGHLNLSDRENYSVMKAYLDSKKKVHAAMAEPYYPGKEDSPFHEDMLSSEEGNRAADLQACMFAVRNGWSVADALKYFKGSKVKG